MTPADAMQVYRQWWLHDARWYQGVAKRFGHEVANEINAEALRFVATHVGKQVARRHGGAPVSGIEQLRDCYDECAGRMFPHELRDGGVQVLDDDLVELTMRQNFAVTMVRMAGSLDGYECPCTDIHAGWSAGLGVALVENRATGCLRHGDRACRLLMRVGETED
ncbi:hypothetical protein GCM10022222_05980 [Amycolatopsis ultiminotia]|uniref:L-2-amino-thiazoline-4-carboxylic acid hydrolase n=1 Tax=Amycolatopsis ultiminotia TaxID=543629 RepID=A0ABP6V2Q6_9PSEU